MSMLCHLTAFEAYWWGSWHAVERLRIKDGAITMHVVDNGEVIEEMIPTSNLRMRSRKATINDCSCILRPGLDVCVLTASSDTEDSSEDSLVSFSMSKFSQAWILFGL